jgi:hypothetical protein
VGGGDGISGNDREGHIKIDDILLLFIYLELGAMVGIYFKTNHMPVRFLIYVAITALTRLLISNVSHHNPPDMGSSTCAADSAAGVFDSGGALRLVAVPIGEDRNPHRKTGAGSSEHPEVEKGEL